MNQEKINKYFESELGQQCNSLFSTSDDNVFIRYQEALNHSIENNLNKDEITEWYEEFSGSDINAQARRTEPCPNCKEMVVECGCVRNKCMRCGNPVGNITFTVCDNCWDKEHKKEA